MKPKPSEETELEAANRQLLEALDDCREELKRAERTLKAQQDNQPTEQQ